MGRDQAVDEDARLLRAHMDGDREAFARLYDRHDRSCFQFIRRILGSAGAEAEDLHQETWLAVSRHAPRFDPLKASFGAWLYTIARRKVWDRTILSWPCRTLDRRLCRRPRAAKRRRP
jgi:RNA polymerase sigma-70 factor (ECF subfamily)